MGDTDTPSDARARPAVFAAHQVTELALDLGASGAIALLPVGVALPRAAVCNRLVLWMDAHGAARDGVGALCTQWACCAVRAELCGPRAILVESYLHELPGGTCNRLRIGIDGEGILCEVAFRGRGRLHFDVGLGAGPFDVLDQICGAVRAIAVDLDGLVDRRTLGGGEHLFEHRRRGRGVADIASCHRQTYAARPPSGLEVVTSDRHSTHSARVYTAPTIPRSVNFRRRGQVRLDALIARRDCLDHVLVFSERHAERILREYVRYYHGRPHRSLRAQRPAGARWLAPARPATSRELTATPVLGGLHHRYASGRRAPPLLRDELKKFLLDFPLSAATRAYRSEIVSRR